MFTLFGKTKDEYTKDELWVLLTDKVAEENKRMEEKHIEKLNEIDIYIYNMQKDKFSWFGWLK